MFDGILVPLDGSDYSAGILRRVRRILLAAGASVELYTVAEPQEPDGPSAEDAQRHLEELKTQLSAEGIRVSTCVELGDPADMILRRIRSTKPSLVAMATHGRSGPSRWLRGSVAERVLRECPAPLFLANPGAEDEDDGQDRIEKILAPFDGSPRAAAIFPVVKAVARLFGSEIILQRVCPYPEEGSPHARKEMLASLEPVRAELGDAGLEVRLRTDFGSPAHEILQAVDAEGADLVALATHGSSGVARWFFGSVTEKVLARCPQPLLVVSTRPTDTPD